MNLLGVDHPANSPHVIGAGGTTPTCSGGMTAGNPACAGYGSESGWSGSGGGVSILFPRPGWQSGCDVPAGAGRLVPDVALEADASPGNYVLKGGFWYVIYGTSGAAPQWAGSFALLNQAIGGSGLGDPGALLYSLCGSNAYHDIATGSNGDYSATSGYDLVTGLGTIDTANFMAAATLPEPGMPVCLAASLAILAWLSRRKPRMLGPAQVGTPAARAAPPERRERVGQAGQISVESVAPRPAQRRSRARAGLRRFGSLRSPAISASSCNRTSPNESGYFPRLSA